MSALTNGAARRYSSGRCAVYERLLADPSARWTVRGMAATVPVSLDAVRDIFYLLVSKGILRVVPRCYPLTFGITRGGVPPLRRTMRLCQGGGGRAGGRA